MFKFFVLTAVVTVSCQKLETMRLQNKQSSVKSVRLTVTYLGSDNCRRYLEKQGRSPEYINTVVARNEKFGRYTTHLLGGENGDFAGTNKQEFSGDKFFAEEYRRRQTASPRSLITQLGKYGASKRLLSMRTIETNCRRLLVNIYSPDRRPTVSVAPGTRIYPQQLQRFGEDFADDYGGIDCGAGHPCSFTKIKGWYFLYVIPDVDNFVKLSVSEHAETKEYLNVYGLVGYLPAKERADHRNLHLRFAKEALRRAQIKDLSVTTLDVRINCQDKNWQEAKVYHIDDLDGRYTSLKINARDLVEHFSTRRFSRLGKRHVCYQTTLNPSDPQNLGIVWPAIHLQFRFVTLGQPPEIFQHRFAGKEEWLAWYEGRGSIIATADNNKQLAVLLTAP